MDRRKMIVGTGALAIASAAGMAFAHKGEQHKGAEENPNKAVIDSSLECIGSGHLCIEHALGLFARGDNSLARCAREIHELVAVCDTLAQLASYNSRQIKNYMKMAIEVCKETEKECRKFAKEHKPCLDCAESCAKCIKACEKAILA